MVVAVILVDRFGIVVERAMGEYVEEDIAVEMGEGGQRVEVGSGHG
jgi:hypothetical protein